MIEKPTPVPATVYGDFADPRSYLASLRVDALLAEGLPALRWKAVQHRPSLPPGGVRLDGSAHAIRGAELRQACKMLVSGERCDARNPDFLPHTGMASTVYATAVQLGVGDEVRRLLFDGYWIRGLDIGNSKIVRQIIKPILERAHPSGNAKEQYFSLQIGAGHIARTWQQEWLSMGTPIELTVVTPRHDAEYGTDALDRLRPSRQFAA